jgi:uncharacterized protein YjaZ
LPVRPIRVKGYFRRRRHTEKKAASLLDTLIKEGLAEVQDEKKEPV